MSNRNERLQAELASHLEMAIRDRMDHGESRAEAEANARREMGSDVLIADVTRDTWRWYWMEQLLSDIRYGLRAMRRNPGFTAVAVIALALGIGANSAIFSAVNAILLRPLAYREPDKLVVIMNHGLGPASPFNFRLWKAQSASFESMGAAEYWTPDMTSTDQPEKLWGIRITSDILPMLGIAPMKGRFFTADEDLSGHEFELLISYNLWQRQFAGDPNILGRTMQLDTKTYTIIGVMPAQFKFAPFWATKASIWAPIALNARAESHANSLRIFARLKPGITLQQAKAEFAGVTARLEQQYPGTNRNWWIVPLQEKVVGNIRPALLTLLAAVACVLLIACANVAHMLLARSAARSREVAVRVALGAGRWRMIRQFLTESLMLSLAGGAAGLLLAHWGVRAIVAFGPKSIPRLDALHLDWRVVAFTFAVSLATGIVFGLAPAWQASRVDPGESLKEGGRSGGEGSPRQRLRSLLVVSEFALALMLLIGAGLMLRTFFALESLDPGMNTHHVLSLLVSVGGAQDGTLLAHRAELYRQIIERVRALPGVESAAFTNHLPIAGDLWGLAFFVEGRPIPRPGEAPDAVYRVTMPGYMETMGMHLLRGRTIAESDAESAPGVVVINEYMAGRFWPGEEALGKRISMSNPTAAADKIQWMTVVGVVKNGVRDEWSATPSEEMFLPYAQKASTVGHYMTLVVRTTGDPAAMTEPVENRIWSVDRNLTVSEVQSMDAVVARATAEPRFNMALLTAFAIIALLLAAIGIYGVMSYAVARRRQEIGIRMALGARQMDVVQMIARQGMSLALTGTAAGVAGAFLLTRLMKKLLYGVDPGDPATFLAVPLVLLAVALAACLIPARRASKTSPMTALRYE